VEFNNASTTFRAHPTWSCVPVGTAASLIQDDAGLGVWDITQPVVQAYLAGVIDRLVNDWGVHYFKFDFMTWLDCPPHDYNDYEDAFAHWVDTIERAHPTSRSSSTRPTISACGRSSRPHADRPGSTTRTAIHCRAALRSSAARSCSTTSGARRRGSRRRRSVRGCTTGRCRTASRPTT